MDFDYTELAQSVIAGWTNDPARRVLAALVGIALLANFVLRIIHRKNLNLLSLAFTALASTTLLSLAFYPKELLTSLMQIEYLTRLRLLMGGASSLVIVITLEAVRRERLRERYALLWLATGLVILSVVLFPEVLALFRAVTGMKYWSALGAVAFIFLTLLAFHFSLAISRLHSHTTRLTQRLAVLEAQLKDMASMSRNDSRTPPPATEAKPLKPDAP